jgi:hypothetical protein
MLYPLDIGNNSQSLDAKSLRGQIEPTSQMIEPVTTFGSPFLRKSKLLDIAAEIVLFLYQQLGERCSFLRRKTGIVVKKTEIVIDVCAGNEPVVGRFSRASRIVEQREKFSFFLSQHLANHIASATPGVAISKELLVQGNIFLADKYRRAGS